MKEKLHSRECQKNSLRAHTKYRQCSKSHKNYKQCQSQIIAKHWNTIANLFTPLGEKMNMCENTKDLFKQPQLHPYTELHLEQNDDLYNHVSFPMGRETYQIFSINETATFII